MPEPATWIDVAQDAVKIGLGAIIGGGISIIIAMLSRSHENRKLYAENIIKNIERVNNDVGEFNAIFNIFWADVRNIIDDRAAGKDIYPKKKKLKEIEAELYSKFPVITNNINNLIIINKDSSSKSLTALGEKCSEFYKFANLDDENLTGERCDEYKKEIENLRRTLFK